MAVATIYADHALGWIFLVVMASFDRARDRRMAYQSEEIAVLREKLGPGRLIFTDGQRRRLARAAFKIRRRSHAA